MVLATPPTATITARASPTTPRPISSGWPMQQYQRTVPPCSTVTLTFIGSLLPARPWARGFKGGLKHTPLCQGCLPITDHNVINSRTSIRASASFNRKVIDSSARAEFGNPGRMVMSNNDRGGVVMQGSFHYLAWVNGGTVNRAEKQFLVLNNPVFSIQKQAGKHTSL